ncbi:MAG: CocE/NonD family hydrolase [Acidimicrobiales bacterium]
MPDAVQLRYSVLLPGSTGSYPVVIQYTGYDSGTIGGSAYQEGNTWLSEDVDMGLLNSGYAVMGVSIRGTGCSTGKFNFYSSDWGTDGAQAVQWAAQQPWSTGQIGMYDWSWGGISQLFVASERPANLVCIAPGEVTTDVLRDVAGPGGILNPLFPTLWWATILDSWTYNLQNAESDGDTEGVANAMHNYAVGQATSPPTDIHPYEDAWWVQRDLRAATANIDIPVLSLELWQDEEVGPRGGYYQELLNPHTTWYVGSNGEHDTYVNDQFRAQLLTPFFDHYLKGINNGFQKSNRVQLWMETSAAGAPMSSDAQLELAEPAWVIELPSLPIPVTPVTLHLSGAGTLCTTSAPPTASGVTYEVLPGPTVNDGLVGSITGGEGGPPSEYTWELDVLVPGTYAAFTTGPLVQDLTLSGSASLNLWISSAAPDTDIQATITEVRPDGQELYVQRGWLNVSQRAIDPQLSNKLRPVHLQTLASVALLEPGIPVEARVEINKFTHTFRTGSALRLIIDGPSNTGDWAFASEAGTTNTVWCDADHPSALVVGLLSTQQAPVGYPAPNTLIGQPCRSNTINVPIEPTVAWLETLP